MKKVFFMALLFVIVSGLFGLLQAENNKGDKMEFQTEIFHYLVKNGHCLPLEQKILLIQ